MAKTVGKVGRSRLAEAEGKPYEISPKVAQQALTRPYARTPGAPLTRPLRIFALDPSVSARVGGVATVHVPYEALRPGPVGSLFQIDSEGAPPPLKVAPLDLDHPHNLLTDGVAPSPANGPFHLQMAYAVCNLTYAAFRRALGRDVAWACGVPSGPDGARRLRVRPFAFRDENAYYAREDDGLSFGYFDARKRPAGQTVPNGLIFSGLSHDIVAHETSHALLDGLRSQFYDPADRDVLGFHEGFADLVALFLHFTYADVVEHAIAASRGALSHPSMLTDLAGEFGYATSSPRNPAALRSAVDVAGIQAFDSDALPPRSKGPTQYEAGMEEHDLGSVLVSAVFEAFVTVFRRKSERLLRIAGLAPEDVGRVELGGELLRALAETARLLAEQFLNVCIRAVDYCPPVDMGLGEYLRALITADAEVVPDDKWGYREALMRSFRRRSIFPDHVRFMAEDALKWAPPDRAVLIPGLAFDRLRFDGDPGRAAGVEELRRQADVLGQYVSDPRNAGAFQIHPPDGEKPRGIEYVAPPRIESIRCARRVSPDGPILFDLIAEVLQSGTVRRGSTLFDFSGGSTVVIDPFGQVRYVIYKKLDSVERQESQYRAMRGPMKRYWRRVGKRLVPVASVFKALHRRR
jgi:hypothetical protein